MCVEMAIAKVLCQLVWSENQCGSHSDDQRSYILLRGQAAVLKVKG